MTTVTINDKSEKGKSLIEYLKSTYDTSTVKFVDTTTTREVRQAIRDIKAGRVEPIENLLK